VIAFMMIVSFVPPPRFISFFADLVLAPDGFLVFTSSVAPARAATQSLHPTYSTGSPLTMILRKPSTERGALLLVCSKMI
jgi:hypothetical protein